MRSGCAVSTERGHQRRGLQVKHSAYGTKDENGEANPQKSVHEFISRVVTPSHKTMFIN
jgi:hypothetical protein